MKRVVWVAGLLVVLMGILFPMAWASPTDPTWGTGMYDDADFDDVVAYLTSGMTGIPGLPIVYHVSFMVFVSAGPLLSESFPPVPPAATRSPRAPPLA